MTSRAKSSRLAQMSACVARPAWFKRITWSTCAASNSFSRARIVAGEPMSPAVSVSCAFGVCRHSW